MKYTVRKSIIQVVGVIWMPAATCALPMTLCPYDVENCRDDDGKITRESVELWLCTHAGDFQSITDFSASIEDGETTVEIPFATEDGEMAWCDCMCHD